MTLGSPGLQSGTDTNFCIPSIVPQVSNLKVIVLKLVELIGLEPIRLSACKANPGTHAQTP